ncbi:hypothetical protein AOLI_G00233650 [Acnodon oligacanthus]
MKILVIFSFYLISGPGSCFSVIGYPEGSVMIYCSHKEDGGINKYFCKSWSSYDPCCSGPNTVSGDLGETGTISRSYPDEFRRNTKLFYKWTGEHFTEVIRTSETQRGRFSISDDRRSKVLSVRISDVREDDGGVYFCGAEDGMGSFSYNSFFTEVRLQVSAFSMIITACVCVALLLIGGSALIYYKLRCEKTPESFFIRKQSRANEMMESVYENDPLGNQNKIVMGQVYHNVKLNISELDSVYQSLDPGMVSDAAGRSFEFKQLRLLPEKQGPTKPERRGETDAQKPAHYRQQQALVYY